MAELMGKGQSTTADVKVPVHHGDTAAFQQKGLAVGSVAPEIEREAEKAHGLEPACDVKQWLIDVCAQDRAGSARSVLDLRPSGGPIKRIGTGEGRESRIM